MRCPACDHDNRAERRFCVECGAALATLCAACGASTEPGEQFCGGCGTSLVSSNQSAAGSPRPSQTTNRPTTNNLARSPHSYTPKHLADKILQSKSALEGERKQVTVLFADVKGSMELAEQLARTRGTRSSTNSFWAADAIEPARASLHLHSLANKANAGWSATLLAEVLLAAGDLSAAQSAAEEAIALCRRSLRGHSEAAAHGILARALLRRDGAAAREAAEAALDAASALIARTGAKTLAPALCEWAPS